jgi:hypothetical protein
MDERNKTTYFTDFSIPTTLNVSNTEKWRNYLPSAEEILKIWQQDKTEVIAVKVKQFHYTPW